MLSTFFSKLALRGELAILCTLLTCWVNAQHVTCSFDEAHQHVAHDPLLQEQMTQIMNLAEDMMNSSPSRAGTNSFTIPVVFHVIHNGGTGNISDAQIESQLDRLNAEFAGNPNSVTGASMNIQFCFAQNTQDDTPNWTDYGSTHAGITRHLDPVNSTIGTGGDGPLVANYGFPANRYLNIYVIEEVTGSALGYSNFTGQLGVVIENQIVGNSADPACNCTLLADFDLGLALVHEVGHYLGLPHPWGFFTGECQEDDGIDDTPRTFGPNYFCPPPVNSCPDTPTDFVDQIENYMDYTSESCKNAFTVGQRCVMHAMIQNNVTIANLVTPANHVRTGIASATGCIPVSLLPTFEASTLLPCTGELFDITVFNGATSTLDEWEVVITNGTSTFTANGINVTGNILVPVTLPDPGFYTMTITLTDSSLTPGTASATFTNTFFASDCQPICDGAFWHFSKSTNDQGMGLRMNFSNGAVLESYTFGAGTSFGNQLAGGTYSYPCGNDMFFTDGKHVRGVTAEYVIDGQSAFSIDGCAPPGPRRAAGDNQGVIGIPIDSNRVTVFTVTDNRPSGCIETPYGLRMHTVNTTTPVAVTSAFPGISPGANYSFVDAITAIPHCTGAGTWIITKGASDVVTGSAGPSVQAEEQIFAYLYDGTSIGSPTVSSSLPYSVDPNDIGTWDALVEASPDGRWLIYSAGGTSYIYEFNALTGTATYKAQLGGVATAFSASGDLLYALNGTVLSQYDFSHFRECCILLPPVDIPIDQAFWMQRGPDGKIYLWRNSSVSLGMAVVNAPDVRIENGNLAAVGYLANALPYPFVGVGTPRDGVPNFIEATTSQGVDFYCCVSNCNDVIFRAEGCADGYTWDLGNGVTGTGSSINTTYMPDGAYTVTLTTNSGMSVTKTIQIGFPIPPEVLPEGNICLSADMTYNTNFPGMQYQWFVDVGGTLNSDPNLPYAEVSWADPLVGGTVCVQITDPVTGCVSDFICFDQEPCEPCTELTVTAVVKAACENDGGITLTVTGGSGQYSYAWTPAGLPASSVLQGLVAGTYTVEVGDALFPECRGMLEVTVPTEPGCGSECEDPLLIKFGESPPALCYERDENFTYYYINLHIPNWDGSQDPPAFQFCGDAYSFSVGDLLDPYVSVTPVVFALEGFLRVPNASVPGQVCVTVPICQDEEEVCGQFCFDIAPCPLECPIWDIQSQVTQTYVGLATSPPCGVASPTYHVYNMNMVIDVTIPPVLVGNDFSVAIYSMVGELCTEGWIQGQPFITNAPVTFQVPYSSLYNAYDANHFCYRIVLKNETSGHQCEERFCVPLDTPSVASFQKTALENPLRVGTSSQTGEVWITGVEDDAWSYEVYSVLGQFMQQGRLTSTETQQLSFPELGTGYYVIRLHHAVTKQTQVASFVKW